MKSSAACAGLADELAALEEAGLLRHRRVLQSPQRARVTVDDREYVAFCSNDYLGLASHPELIEAACAGAREDGVGAGASHLILGHTQAHHALERALAEFVRLPRAVFFSTGYMANLGLVTTLAGRRAAIFADRLNHASLVDAAVLSRAELKRYPHSDLAALERSLRTSDAKTRVIVTDSVFSMDGDIAALPALLALAERYDAWLVIDDAHGFGVLGHGGRGVLDHFGLASKRIAYMATLGKAAGVYGAFVAGEPELVETLIQRARTYIYTTATPPLIARALLVSVKLIEAGDERRSHLAALVARVRRGLAQSRWRLLPSETAVQALVVGDNKDAVSLSEKLAECGLLVPAIRPPTVPRGTARLRISLSADHRVEDVERLTDALCSLSKAA